MLDRKGADLGSCEMAKQQVVIHVACASPNRYNRRQEWSLFPSLGERDREYAHVPCFLQDGICGHSFEEESDKMLEAVLAL